MGTTACRAAAAVTFWALHSIYLAMERFDSFAMTTAAVGERDLIVRLKEFDESAWNQLYDAYFSRLHRYFYVRVGTQGEAEELAAQVFEEACKRIRGYRYRGSSISAWLYRIAHNRFVDWTRKRRPVPMMKEAAQPDQSEQVAARDELARALSGLSPDQQQVLVLRHIEGHSAASAGEIMGKRAGAVRSLEFRALGIFEASPQSRGGGGAFTMKRTIEAALDACLARLAQDESVEQCLRDHEVIASELRPLLEAAEAMRARAAGIPEASSQAVASGRVRLQTVRSRQAAAKDLGGPLRGGLGLVAIAVGVVALVAVGLVSMFIDLGGTTRPAQAVGTVSSASADTIVLNTDEGQFVVRIGGQTAVLDRSGNAIAVDEIVPGARARVEFEEGEDGFSGLKVEIEEDEEAGSAGAEVEFSGMIQSISEGSMALQASFGTATVRIDEATKVEGAPQPGRTANIHATVLPDGSYGAREIEVTGEDGDGEE